MVYAYVMCMFCKRPEVTLCGWRANKPVGGSDDDDGGGGGGGGGRTGCRAEK